MCYGVPLMIIEKAARACTPTHTVLFRLFRFLIKLALMTLYSSMLSHHRLQWTGNYNAHHIVVSEGHTYCDYAFVFLRTFILIFLFFYSSIK